MANLIEPMRRALPLPEWPQADQAPGPPPSPQAISSTPAAARLIGRPATRQTNIQHYGRWLGYLPGPVNSITDERRPIGSPAMPCGRTTSISRRFVAPLTRLSMLVGLKVMMQAMAPEQDWRWLQDVCNRIQITAQAEQGQTRADAADGRDRGGRDRRAGAPSLPAS